MLFKILLVSLAITANVCSGYEASADYNCISSCAGKQDGGYTLCGGNCNRYAMCSYYELTEKSCPSAVNSYGNEQLTQWDDESKQCVETSSTCPQVPIGQCVPDCTDVPDGDYQSCTQCTEFVKCVGGSSMYNMQCPPTLLWDDGLKRCEYESNTCPLGKCIYDCDDELDGDYQSCEGCDVYVSCSGGYLTNRQCPEDTLWDDNSKMCDYESTTCAVPYN